MKQAYAFVLGFLERNAAFGTYFSNPEMRRAYLKGRYWVARRGL